MYILEGIPRIGVAALVFDPDRRILLIRRRTPPARGLWSIPGGKQKAGETLVEACCREVLEETGLEITLGPIVAVVERIESEFHYVIIDFLASPKSRGPLTLHAADDVSDVRWVETGDLAQYEIVEGLAAIIHVARELSLGKAPDSGLRHRGNNCSDFVALRDF
ncbi:MAG: NUDIX hydrolase [Methylococcales bacterium]